MTPAPDCPNCSQLAECARREPLGLPLLCERTDAECGIPVHERVGRGGQQGWLEKLHAPLRKEYDPFSPGDGPRLA